MSKKFLEGLNDEQRQAVEHSHGPLLILAGAGSGKTKTLTHRIAYLIAEQGVAPAHILAVTFTNKAAGEMRERVEQLLGGHQSIPYLGTFHSICVRILRESGTGIGVPANFVIFDDADSLSLIKQAMQELRIDETTLAPRAALSYISSAKNELIDAATYAGLASLPVQRRAAEIYPLYQRLLEQARALDFDDLIMKTVRLFKTDAQAYALWSGRFEHILVDEYQDTNTAQYELIKLLARPHGNLCVVGDDWQSIYSWRGADFRNILNFERDWPKVTTVKLEQNYRSTKAILAAAHQVITKNKQRSDKRLWSVGPDGTPVQIIPVANERAEAETIISRIKIATDIGAQKLRDFAVLYRTNAQSRTLEEVFVRYGLPYRIVGGLRFYERAEIKDILAYLRFAYQPDDLVAFRRLINVPPRGIGRVSLEHILTAAAEHSLLSVLEAPERHVPRLSTKSRTSLIALAAIVNRTRADFAAGVPLSRLVEDIIRATGYLEHLDDGTVRAAERIENVRELISVAREYDAAGLAAFLEEVALVSDIDQWDATADAVTLMTVHAAKGLEFPIIFMAGMEEGIFPHSRSLFEPDAMEEERRLAYVGMTRAKAELYLLYAHSRLLYGTTQHAPPSRFLSDLGDSATTLAGSASLPIESAPPPTLEVAVGDRVRHPIFGEGIVEELDGEAVTVAFQGHSVKRLHLGFAPLEPVKRS